MKRFCHKSLQKYVGCQRLFVLLLLVGSLSVSAQKMTIHRYIDTTLPDLEQNPDYGFVLPVSADVWTNTNYSPSFGNRYFMSLFGPRYKQTSSSSIGYYDFHQGMDVAAAVSWNGVQYNDTLRYYIVSCCDGRIHSVIDSTDAYLETLATGRSVKVTCDSSFRANPSWGAIYMNYRHLSSLHTLPALAKNAPQNSIVIHKGDTIGMVGESGLTSTVHLHYSIQRYEPGSPGSDLKNMHPKRIFPPGEAPHLHHILDSLDVDLLETWGDSALFRIAIPYNQMSVKRIEVFNSTYHRVFDYEAISDSSNRDHHDIVSGLKLFAYSFNRGSTVLSRYNATKTTMPAAYPASPNRDTINGFYAPITNNTVTYILDLIAHDLPAAYNPHDFIVKISDLYGNVVEASFINPAAIGETKEPFAVHLYPNPAAVSFRIESPEFAKIARIRIVNPLNSVAFDYELVGVDKEEISIRQLPAALYFVQLIGHNEQLLGVRKLFLEK